MKKGRWENKKKRSKTLFGPVPNHFGPLSPSLGPANRPPRAGLSSFPLPCGPLLPVSPPGGSLWPGLRLLRATRSVARTLTGRRGIRGPLGRLIPRPSRHKEPCRDLPVAHAPSPIFSPRTKAPHCYCRVIDLGALLGPGAHRWPWTSAAFDSEGR